MPPAAATFAAIAQRPGQWFWPTVPPPSPCVVFSVHGL